MPPLVGLASLSKPANTASRLAALGGAVDPNLVVLVPGMIVLVSAMRTAGLMPPAGASVVPSMSVIRASVRSR